MTGTSARNHYGIFKTKKALNLAIKYSLELNNMRAYIHTGKYITYTDVKFITDNLWLNHFLEDRPKPIETTIEEYEKIYNHIKLKYNNFI